MNQEVNNIDFMSTQMEQNTGMQFTDNIRLRSMYQETARNAIKARTQNPKLNLTQPILRNLLNWVIVAGNDSTTGAALPRHVDGGVPPRGHDGAQRRGGKKGEAKIRAEPFQSGQAVSAINIQ